MPTPASPLRSNFCRKNKKHRASPALFSITKEFLGWSFGSRFFGFANVDRFVAADRFEIQEQQEINRRHGHRHLRDRAQRVTRSSQVRIHDRSLLRRTLTFRDVAHSA